LPAGTCSLMYPVIFLAMIHFQLPIGDFQLLDLKLKL